MSDSYVMCTRATKGNRFIPEPGQTRFLRVPAGLLPSVQHETDRDEWFASLRNDAVWGKDARDNTKSRGDILFFVHGYNNSQEIVMKRHLQLENDLRAAGFKGVIVSFDWPSDDKALNYVEDRHDAKITAMQLVSDAISILSEMQTPDCYVNVHLLCHSTGAFVVREAFDDADDCKLKNNAWMVSQLVFIGADISAESMTEANPTTESLYRHCLRLTNYSSLYDSVLKLSNAKRAGLASRVGRVGLPDTAPSKAVNVDCSAYFELLSADGNIRQRDQVQVIGTFEHSWHIGNKKFAQDLFETLKGDLDRSVIPTRRELKNNRLILN